MHYLIFSLKMHEVIIDQGRRDFPYNEPCYTFSIYQVITVWFLFRLWVDNNIYELLNHVLCIIGENNVDFNCSTWLLSAGFLRHVPPDLMHSNWEKLHTKIKTIKIQFFFIYWTNAINIVFTRQC